MQILITTAIAVATMLAYAVPGYLTVRCKLIRAESISAFSVLLMYVCQPMLTITSFLNATYTLDFFWKMIVAFVLAGVLQLGVILIAHFCLKKHYDKDIKYRVATVATAFGNCGFMGVPLLQAIMPEAVRNNAVVLSVMFLLGLNLIGWTFASYLISGDKKFISVKKAFINPAMLGLVIGLPLFICNVTLPKEIFTCVELLGKMTTPLCMIILGMRLATITLKEMFCSPFQYAIVGVKQIVMPMLGLLLIWFIPIDFYIRQSLFILAATPVASITLNFAEMLGKGQKTAANLVLLGTILSVVTLPLMALIMNVVPDIYALA